MGLLKLKANPDLNRKAKNEAKRLAEILSRKLKVQRIILFGSAVEGSFTPDSDLDILLVFANHEDLENSKTLLYGKPLSSFAVDFILKTEKEYNLRKDVGGVCFIASREGLDLYGG
tara:strand:- start:12161 stop:12508 length:348 start_codon:yes stop_codon:yes gene_type:complete